MNSGLAGQVGSGAGLGPSLNSTSITRRPGLKRPDSTGRGTLLGCVHRGAMWGSRAANLFQNVTNLTTNLTNAAVNMLDPDAEEVGNVYRTPRSAHLPDLTLNQFLYPQIRMKSPTMMRMRSETRTWTIGKLGSAGMRHPCRTLWRRDDAWLTWAAWLARAVHG